MSSRFITVWRTSSFVVVVMSCSLVRATDEEGFVRSVRDAHALLEQKCLWNVRIEESFVQYVNDHPSPPRYNHYKANSSSYLVRTWTAGATDGFVERIVINRPDGRYSLGKRASGEYVLGGYGPPKPVPESLDLTFYQTFAFFSVWTKGSVADLVSEKSTSFRVVGRERGEIEIEISQYDGDRKWPFTLSPFRIVFDDQTHVVKVIRGRRTESGRPIAIEAEYKDGFPQKITVRAGASPEAMKVSSVHEFAVYRTEDVPNTEFGLEQFGIPEPNPEYQKRQFRVPRFAWFAGAGLLAGVVYLVARRRLARG